MTPIKIYKLIDHHDCELCGCGYAEGAVVYVNGEAVIKLNPVAHCFDGDHYTEEDVFREILAHLGYSLEIVEAA